MLSAENIERFMAKVNRGGGLFACWEWLAGKDSYGYGRFRIDGKSYYAHRLAYEYFIGPIPEGLTIDHICRVRPCINPYCMEPVTHRVNTLRGEGLTAQNARKTLCKRGHRFTVLNTYIRLDGRRNCRECARWDRVRYKNRLTASK